MTDDVVKIITRGAYRVRVIRDAYADAPDWEHVTDDEWRMYREGDVYLYVIEECVRWSPVSPAVHATQANEGHQTWETIESCGALYGLTWAISNATEALSAYAPEDGES